MEEMLEVDKRDLFVGKSGDIKYDLLIATSPSYNVYPFGSRATGPGRSTSGYGGVFTD